MPTTGRRAMAAPAMLMGFVVLAALGGLAEAAPTASSMPAPSGCPSAWTASGVAGSPSVDPSLPIPGASTRAVVASPASSGMSSPLPSASGSTVDCASWAPVVPASTLGATLGASPRLSPIGTPTPRRTQRPSGALLGGYITHIRTRRKVIALTLDEDLRPGMYATRHRTRWYDPRIIRLLERTGTHATVFLNGLFAKAYPGVLRRLAGNPDIELANHSWDHQGWQRSCGPNDPMLRPPMTKTREVRMTERIVRRMVGVRLRYFRFPAGCHSSADVRLVERLDEQPIGWSCYFGDGLYWPTSRQIRNVKATCGPGGIVITHLNGPPYHDGVYEALVKLIPWWKAHGWEVVTVGELLGHPTR